MPAMLEAATGRLSPDEFDPSFDPRRFYEAIATILADLQEAGIVIDDEFFEQ